MILRQATSRTPENVERVLAVINKDRRLTVRELEADLGVPRTAMSEILTQGLGMKCVVAKFVPRLLLPEQKEHCAAVANDLIQTPTNEPDFLKKDITRDKSCVYGCGPVVPMEAAWFSMFEEGMRQSCSKITTMLTVFFDWCLPVKIFERCLP